MNEIDYILEIRFASPFLMVPAAAFLLLALGAWRRRSAIVHPYLGFFQRSATKGSHNPIFWLYRALPYVILAIVVLGIGNPLHEEYEGRSGNITSYLVICDASGSLAAVDETGSSTLIFEDSLLNSMRLSLIDFVGEQRETAELFLLCYSDVPYAARYFVGGKEAEVQIGDFLERLPQEIERSRRIPGSRFYVKGTRTAFALDAALRYYESFPQERRQSVPILITDLEDSKLLEIANALDRFVERGLEQNIYVVVFSGKEQDKRIRTVREAISYPAQIHFPEAHDKASLDRVLRAIAQAEQAPSEVTYEVFRSRSLRAYFIIAALVCLMLFITIEEITVRRIP